jgi:ubiquitin-conjugating enzyme E2 A
MKEYVRRVKATVEESWLDPEEKADVDKDLEEDLEEEREE